MVEHGGKRKGSGRSKILRNPKIITLSLDKKHLVILRKLKKKYGLTYRSEVVRRLIERARV